MKYLILIILLTGCAWSNTDKTLITMNGVLMTIDMFQTLDIYNRENEGYHEVNPVVDWGVDQIGKSFVPMYFAASFGARYAIADYLTNYRSLFLTTTGIVSLGLVLHNNSIGLRVNF